MKERRILRTREFMQLLLTTDTFDRWLLSQAQLVCASTWTIDGHVNRAYYEDGDRDQNVPTKTFVPWSELRPTVLSLIRGKRTPVSFTFLFMPPEETDADTAADPFLSAEDGTADFDRVLRIRFQDGHVLAASAVSMRAFSLDKEPEHKWDEVLSRYLDHLGIAFEEL